MSLYAAITQTSGATPVSGTSTVLTPIGAGYNTASAPVMVSDGYNGAIVVWSTSNGTPGLQGKLFAQRVNSSGTRLWPNNMIITSAPDQKIGSPIVAQGDGGAIVAFGDRRNGTDYDIFATHLNGDGTIGPYPGTIESVMAGQTGNIVGGSTQATVNITANSDVDGGLLQFRTYTTSPGGTFTGASATAQGGAIITPNVVNPNRYWQIDSLGVGPITYNVSLNMTAVSGVNYLQNVLLKRSDPTAPWEPLNTTQSGTSLVANGLTSFSEFAVGSETSAVGDWELY